MAGVLLCRALLLKGQRVGVSLGKVGSFSPVLSRRVIGQVRYGRGRKGTCTETWKHFKSTLRQPCLLSFCNRAALTLFFCLRGIHVYIYIYICICVCIHIYIYIYIYTYLLYIYNIYTCVYICISFSLSLSLYIYIYIHVYTRVVWELFNISRKQNSMTSFRRRCYDIYTFICFGNRTQQPVLAGFCHASYMPRWLAPPHVGKGENNGLYSAIIDCNLIILIIMTTHLSLSLSVYSLYIYIYIHILVYTCIYIYIYI